MPDTPLHTTRLAVRWGDMDALGHVNNAVYFTYFEQARIEYLQRLAGAGALDTAGAGPVLAAIEATFRRPVVHPAAVVVRVFGGEVGRTSFPLAYALTVEGDEGAVYAEARSTIVWVDRASGRPTPLPDALRRHLAV